MDNGREADGNRLDSRSNSSSTESRSMDSMAGDDEWEKMKVEMDNEEEHDGGSLGNSGRCSSLLKCVKASGDCHALYKAHYFSFLASLLIFAVFCGAGLTIVGIVGNTDKQQARDDALGLAEDTGQWFSEQLDRAILPVFSMAQFASELEAFRGLPDEVGPAFSPGSLPFLPQSTTGGVVSRRNYTGVCDRPELVGRFSEVAATIKKNAKMERVLVNIQLAPQGVVCLLYPLNNTEDFDDGMFLDSTGALGLDLFVDPAMRFIAKSSIPKEEISIAGPLQLKQCPTCDPFFIARLPVVSDHHEIVIDDVSYPRWGFATAIINWKELVDRSGVHEMFEARGYKFQLTRTDRNFNSDTGLYEENIVVLAESPRYNAFSESKTVKTDLQTTNNEWQITVQYSDRHPWIAVATTICVILSVLVALLVYVVLRQKHMHSAMLARTMAQAARVDVEKNITAYFAHELRNPLGAIDSALLAMPDDLPGDAKELVSSMQLCTSFMSSLMNNLLDVRKMEEGKMAFHLKPMSLHDLVVELYKMEKMSVKSGVEFITICKTDSRDWVLGDKHRIQQVLTNILTNAIKYTLAGSITLSVVWIGGKVRFECADTGPGIPKGQQEKLFERFVQRGGAPGTGLGLAISKQIVDGMGGCIRFESDPTIRPGTSCIVDLPLEICAIPDAVSEITSDAAPIKGALKFLIVDDIKMNRIMLTRRILKAIAPDSVIMEASTGEEALEICKEQRFDVIIVDQYMEGAGGVLVGTDVVMALRRMKVRSVIVGCSGNDLEEEFRDAGATLAWTKPLPSCATMIQQLQSTLPDTIHSRNTPDVEDANSSEFAV